MFGMGVGVATADAGAGVGVAARETLIVTVAVLPAGARHSAPALRPSIKVPGLRRLFLLARTKQPGAKNPRQEAENMTLPGNLCIRRQETP